MFSNPRPNPYEVYFRLVGPLKVIYHHPKAKVEGVCHKPGCHWGWYEWTAEECKQALLRHLWDQHSDQPKPDPHDRLPMPGR